MAKSDNTNSLTGKFKGAVDVGDVLGVNFELPTGLERLTGWTVYNIRGDGVPQVLQPRGSAPEERMGLGAALRYVRTLQAAGHETAHLWTESDAGAIHHNIVRKDYNDDQGLASGRFWGNPLEASDNAKLSKMFYPGDGTSTWEEDPRVGDVRVVQNVPELSRS